MVNEFDKVYSVVINDLHGIRYQHENSLITVQLQLFRPGRILCSDESPNDFGKNH